MMSRNEAIMTSTDLQKLFDNKLDKITVENILSPKQISDFLAAVEQQPEWQETAVDDPHKRLFKDVPLPQFIFLSQYGIVASNIDEEKYLAIAEDYRKIWSRIISAAGFNPFDELKNYFKKVFNQDIKIISKNNKDYFPLTVRNLKDPVLAHADFGPFDGPNWAINKVVKQIAWNIYLTDPVQGGETVVYDYVWENKDVIDDDSYGIKELNKPIKTKFSVAPGRLVLFNSRNFHEVKPSSAPRIAVGGLLGQLENGEIVARN